MGLFGKDKTGDGVIDLTTKSTQVWGGPGPCPECDGRGYLDRIDIRMRVMYQHCVDCGHLWSVSEAELASQA